MNITINLTEKTVTSPSWDFPMTIQEAGLNLSDCKSKSDVEDEANDWAIDKGYEAEISVEGNFQ